MKFFRENDKDRRLDEVQEVFEEQEDTLVEIDDNGEVVLPDEERDSKKKPVVIRDPHGEY